MSIFDSNPGPSGSSVAELEAAVAAEPELANADIPEQTIEPPDDGTRTPEPEPEAAAEKPDGAEKAEAKPSRTVPAAALAEAREKARTAEAQLAELKGRFDQFQAMLPQMGQQQPQPAQPEEQAPDPNEDPIGALTYERKQREALQQQLQAMTIQTRVQSDYMADAQAFATRQADFPQAYTYLMQSRVNELRGMGYPDDAIQATVARDEFNIALGALRQRQSPAAALYKLAEARGWKAEPVKPPAAATKPPSDPALAEAKRIAASGISEGGAPPKGELSLDDIAELKGAAFDKAYAAWEQRNKRSAMFRA